MKMMYSKRKQQGAVLLIALVMLLVLTVLTVTNMRGVVLESRITANRMESERLQNLADAATREGEFRFYGPAHLRDKLEPNVTDNCKIDNKLNRYGNNKPCLLNEMTTDLLEDFFSAPISFFKASNSYTNSYDKTNGVGSDEGTDGAGEQDVLAWMPFRGLDPTPANYFTADREKSYWNAYRVMSGSEENETLNPEYGAALEGKGTYFFLITAQANDEIAVQSTVSVIYLGLN